MKKCDVKKFYDTEGEAIIGAAKTEYLLKAEMMPYKCDNHWHICHVDKKLRGKYRPKEIRKHYCDQCKQELDPKNYMKHIRKPRHLRMVAKEGS